MVARRAHNPKVVGSNPAPATSFPVKDLDPILLQVSGYINLVITGFFVIWELQNGHESDFLLGLIRPFFVFLRGNLGYIRTQTGRDAQSAS
jgi:hypothetical protein